MSWICPKCETENPNSLSVCEVCDSPRELSPLDKLKETYSDSAYKTFLRAHASLLDSADKGNADDQFKVGEWFYEHRNSKSASDYDRIFFYWFQKAALQSHVGAMVKMGECYEKGFFIKISSDKAKIWYKKAADQGDENAWRGYVRMKYNNGTYEKVVQYRFLLLVDAEKGNRQSQFLLAEWFYNHETQPTYKAEAIVWYSKAANGGHVEAMWKLGEFYEMGKGVNCSMTAAIRWYKKAARAGNKPSCLKLVSIFLYVKKNVEEAVKWYELSGGGLSGTDLCNIGYAYDVGNGVPINKAKAVEYYRKAAEDGNGVAQFNLGVCYENGRGVPIDLYVAKYWYEKASMQGYQNATKEISRIEAKIAAITKKKVDIYGDCVVPAALISMVILFIYCVLAASFNWPTPDTSDVSSAKNIVFLLFVGL